MSDGGDGLLLRVEVADELERLVIDAKEIGVDLTARQDDRIVVVSRNLVERVVNLDG